MKYFFVLVLATWVATTREMMRLQAELPDMRSKDLATKLQHDVRMFRSQRDFYLVGFSTLLLLVISRLYSTFKEVNLLSATKEALKRQADQAVTAFRSLQEEKELLEKGGAKQTEGDKGDKEAEKQATKKDTKTEDKGAKTESGEATTIAALEEELKEMKLKMEAAEVDKVAACRDAAETKQHAAQLGTKIETLLREKESLQNKLADFELLLGDQVKKSK